MITIKHIAESLGLAHTTVSRALNDHRSISAATKLRVREEAERLGYIPNSGARLMRNGASRMLGLIVPDVQNEFFSAVARALANECAQRGYQVMLGVSEDDPQREEEHVRALLASRALGVMVASCGRSTAATQQMLTRLPHVQLLRFDPDLGPLSVRIADEQALSIATQHLLALGHRHIAYIGSAAELSTGGARLSGYLSAMQNAGLAPDPAWIRLGSTLPEFGHQAVLGLLNDCPAITALIVASSRQLLGALKGLREAQVVIPGHLSLLGYGDTEWFEVSDPAITGMALPVQDMSAHATRLMFSALREPQFTEDAAIFVPQLVIRHSTGPARQKN